MGRPRWGLVTAALAALLAAASPATAWAANARVTFAGTAESGRARVQLAVDDPDLAAGLGDHPDPARFRALVGNGDARIAGVSRVDATGEPVVTVLAFDRSGSFKHHWDQAFELAEAFAAAMPATAGSHTVEVMTFHGQQYWHGTATTGAELRTILADVESLGPLGSSSETTLMSAVQEGARRAASIQPESGARQVLLFTDAGEEGVVFSVDETLEFVRTQGVPVHPVILRDDVRQKQLDRTKKLADGSGGRLLHGVGDDGFRAAMADHATAGERLYWVELSFCGVQPPQGSIHFDDTVVVEVLEGGVRKAITLEAPFRQHGADDALADCASAPVPPPTDPAAVAPPADDRDPLAGLWPWFLGLGGAGLLLLLLLALLFLLLRGREKEPPPASPARENPPTSPPPPARAGAARAAPRARRGGPRRNRGRRRDPGPEEGLGQPPQAGTPARHPAVRGAGPHRPAPVPVRQPQGVHGRGERGRGGPGHRPAQAQRQARHLPALPPR